MAMQLVTGFAGEAHVTAAQDGRRNAGTFGDGRYVLDTGQRFRITVDSANQVTVGTGDGMMDGRHVTNESPVQLTIDSGSQGVRRNDLVVVRYSQDAQSGIETAELAVVKGTGSTSEPTDPALETGSILDGASVAEWALWRIPIDDISVGTPVALYDEAPPISELVEQVGRLDGELLFEGPYSQTYNQKTISMTGSAANYRLLRIFIENNDGSVASVDVWNPDGKIIDATMSTAINRGVYIKSKRYVIEGNLIRTTKTGDSWNYGEAFISSSGSVTWQQVEHVGVTRVIGYR